MSFDAASTQAAIEVGGRPYRYYSLAAVARMTSCAVARLPYCLKVLLENVVRQRATGCGSEGEVETLLGYLSDGGAQGEINFRPMRVMMDDTAGLPLLGDLAAMRDAMPRPDGKPQPIDPVIPVDFIVDHSIIAEHAGSPDALARNTALEFERNRERFEFLRWAGQAFRGLRVVPPGGGICHQINLEYLAQVVSVQGTASGAWLVPDSMVGIDSHTPMVNSLGIVGWGVSGIEGVSAALGEPLALRVPRVVGIRLTGRLRAGITATDLVLTLAQIIRQRDVVGAFVEYYGPGLEHLSLPERATVANMTPECGTTMSYFPIDAETLRYLALTGRTPQRVALVEAYARAQGLWRDEAAGRTHYSDGFELDLASVEPSLSGPSQPHHRIGLADVPGAFAAGADRPLARGGERPAEPAIRDGDVVIAAITSCTNTSNPAAMIGAGLLARNALARGLKCKPWVKTSLSPGSRVVADYLARSGLQQSLDALGFHVTGFGCMTCVGFSGSLSSRVADAIEHHGMATAAVVSGNRNYEGRIHKLIKASFLASPPLVVAYALAGTALRDLAADPIGVDGAGRPVYLHEIWPDTDEITRIIENAIDAPMFKQSYATLYDGSERWRSLVPAQGPRFAWDGRSTFIRRPPEFEDLRADGADLAWDIRGARILGMFGDMVTTEHVSPMGPVPDGSLASAWLRSIGVPPAELGTYAARRLMAEVMARGVFSSPHLLNQMTPGLPGGHTLHQPDGVQMTVFDAAQRYRAENVPLVVIAGKQYGTGSSRDWAAKGPRALGVRAVIAESFERLHRANLVAAGVLPLQFSDASERAAFSGTETLDVTGIAELHTPGTTLSCSVRRADGSVRAVRLRACLETRQEVAHYAAGGTYRYLLRARLREAGASETSVSR